MILNFNFQYSKFLFLTERRWRWVQIVVFDSFVWRLQWCLTVLLSPCILLLLHLQMAGRTDGNPKSNKLQQKHIGPAAWQAKLEPTLDLIGYTWIIKYFKLDIRSLFILYLSWINYLLFGKIFLKVSNKNNKILFVEVFGKNNMLKESLINNGSKWSSSHPLLACPHVKKNRRKWKIKKSLFLRAVWLVFVFLMLL